MEIASLLSRLSGVRKNGRGFVARCPAHEDRSPSLSCSQLDDGRILMHCFAGCGTDAVLGALGLELTDLFPEPLTRERLAPVRPYSANEALRALNHEAAVVLLLASDLANGAKLEDVEPRLAQSVGRIHEISRMADGR